MVSVLERFHRVSALERFHHVPACELIGYVANSLGYFLPLKMATNIHLKY